MIWHKNKIINYKNLFKKFFSDNAPNSKWVSNSIHSKVKLKSSVF